AVVIGSSGPAGLHRSHGGGGRGGRRRTAHFAAESTPQDQHLGEKQQREQRNRTALLVPAHRATRCRTGELLRVGLDAWRLVLVEAADDLLLSRSSGWRPRAGQCRRRELLAEDVGLNG